MHRCAYCGVKVRKPEREHVIPGCLYPTSKESSRIQRVTVKACSKCNHSWEDDEAHFRNVLALAGPPNESRKQVWSVIKRSLQKEDGARRTEDLYGVLKWIEVAGRERCMVFPGEHERVMRVIKKIVRGLCSYHKIMSPVADEQVKASILTFSLPDIIDEAMIKQHRDSDVVEYKYQVVEQFGINSLWILKFYKVTEFVAAVTTNACGPLY